LRAGQKSPRGPNAVSAGVWSPRAMGPQPVVLPPPALDDYPRLLEAADRCVQPRIPLPLAASPVSQGGPGAMAPLRIFWAAAASQACHAWARHLGPRSRRRSSAAPRRPNRGPQVSTTLLAPRRLSPRMARLSRGTSASAIRRFKS
jgi:hypothetical protein